MNRPTDEQRSFAACAALNLIAAYGAMFLSACNTTEGVGEDVAAVGNAIDDDAEDASD